MQRLLSLALNEVTIDGFGIRLPQNFGRPLNYALRPFADFPMAALIPGHGYAHALQAVYTMRLMRDQNINFLRVSAFP